MQGKRRWVILGIIIILGVILMVDYSIHSKVYDFSDEGKIQGATYSVVDDKGNKTTYIDPSGKDRLIEVDNKNYKIDIDQLGKVLTKYQYKRSRKRVDTFHLEDIRIQMPLTVDDEPRHIVLGKYNIWYNGNKYYDFIKGEMLLEELLRLVHDEAVVIELQ